MQGQLGSQSLHPRLHLVQLYDNHTLGSAKCLMHVPAKLCALVSDIVLALVCPLSYLVQCFQIHYVST